MIAKRRTISRKCVTSWSNSNSTLTSFNCHKLKDVAPRASSSVTRGSIIKVKLEVRLKRTRVCDAGASVPILRLGECDRVFPSFPKKSQLAPRLADRSFVSTCKPRAMDHNPNRSLLPQTPTHDRRRVFNSSFEKHRLMFRRRCSMLQFISRLLMRKLIFPRELEEVAASKLLRENRRPEAFKNFEPLAIKFTEYR